MLGRGFVVLLVAVCMCLRLTLRLAHHTHTSSLLATKVFDGSYVYILHITLQKGYRGRPRRELTYYQHHHHRRSFFDRIPSLLAKSKNGLLHT